jgi:anti-sigma B factor antagonist
MKIAVDDKGDSAVIHLTGDLTLSNGPEVRTALRNEIAATDRKSVVVDLSGVHYVDSMGVATLVDALAQSQNKKLEFILTGVQGKLKEVLNLTKLARVFDIRDSVPEQH